MIPPFEPEITAEITMLTTARGGRDDAIPEGEYRGILSARGQHFSFRSEVTVTGGLKPGRVRMLDIQFLFPALALPFFKEQDEFNLWEGGTIAHGRVVKVHAI
jgi:hypothetical protein